MDAIDYKILYSLHYDARKPLSQVAKDANISKQTLNYRINSLKERGIIRGFVAVIDVHKLNHLSYRVYLRLKNANEDKEQELVRTFCMHPSTLWVVSLIGQWDIELVFTAKNYIHFSTLFRKLLEGVGEHIHDYEISMSIVNDHLPRDYLVSKKRHEYSSTYYGYEPEDISLDELDRHILEVLSEDCRVPLTEIARGLDVTYQTVKNRIAALEESGVIQTYRLLIDLEKIGRLHLKACIQLANPTKAQLQELKTFCSQFNELTYIVDVLGSHQFEIEAEVIDLPSFNRILKNIRNVFPELIQQYYILEVTKEHKLNYLPELAYL